MRHSQADSTGGQRTPGRYRLADNVFRARVTARCSCPETASSARPGSVTRPLLSCAAEDAGFGHIDTAQTRTCTHLAENLRACGLWLEDREIVSLDAAFL